MCIVFSIIERVYWYLRVILLNMFVVKSLYVSFPRSSFLCIHFVIFLWEWDGDLLLRTLSHCHFHHYIHYWCDFTSCLIWVDHRLSSYIHCFAVIFIIAYASPHSLHVLFSPYSNPSRVWYSLRTIIIHLIISSVFLHCIIIVTMFTVGIFRSMAHKIFYTCCILYMRAWVLIIGYLGLVSLHSYHPITLAFVTSWVLRPPWGHNITHCVW